MSNEEEEFEKFVVSLGSGLPKSKPKSSTELGIRTRDVKSDDDVWSQMESSDASLPAILKDIVEREDSDDECNLSAKKCENTYNTSSHFKRTIGVGFPEVYHRNDKNNPLHHEIRKDEALQAKTNSIFDLMSKEEILQQQKELASLISPKVLEAFKNRKKSSPQKDSQQSSQSSNNIQQNSKNAGQKEKLNIRAPSITSDSFQKLQQSSPDDKLKWTEPVLPSNGKRSIDAERYGFDGRAISSNDSDKLSDGSGLFHHGDDPDAAGYTINELMHLGMSSFAPQRVMALETLQKIFVSERNSEMTVFEREKFSRNEEAKKSLASPIDDFLSLDGIILLRTCLDEAHDTTLLAALSALDVLLEWPAPSCVSQKSSQKGLRQNIKQEKAEKDGLHKQPETRWPLNDLSIALEEETSSHVLPFSRCTAKPSKRNRIPDITKLRALHQNNLDEKKEASKQTQKDDKEDENDDDSSSNDAESKKDASQKPNDEEKEDSKMNPSPFSKLARKDAIGALLKMKTLDRLRDILSETVMSLSSALRPSASSQSASSSSSSSTSTSTPSSVIISQQHSLELSSVILHILITIARNSPSSAFALLQCKGLLLLIFKNFIKPPPLPRTLNAFFATARLLSLRLIRVISQSSRTAAIGVYSKEFVRSVVRFVYTADSFDSTTGDALAEEALVLLGTWAEYGLSSDNPLVMQYGGLAIESAPSKNALEGNAANEQAKTEQKKETVEANRPSVTILAESAEEASSLRFIEAEENEIEQNDWSWIGVIQPLFVSSATNILSFAKNVQSVACALRTSEISEEHSEKEQSKLDASKYETNETDSRSVQELHDLFNSNKSSVIFVEKFCLLLEKLAHIEAVRQQQNESASMSLSSLEQSLKSSSISSSEIKSTSNSSEASSSIRQSFSIGSTEFISEATLLSYVDLCMSFFSQMHPILASRDAFARLVQLIVERDELLSAQNSNSCTNHVQTNSSCGCASSSSELSNIFIKCITSIIRCVSALLSCATSIIFRVHRSYHSPFSLLDGSQFVTSTASPTEMLALTENIFINDILPLLSLYGIDSFQEKRSKGKHYTQSLFSILMNSVFPTLPNRINETMQNSGKDSTSVKGSPHLLSSIASPPHLSLAWTAYALSCTYDTTFSLFLNISRASSVFMHSFANMLLVILQLNPSLWGLGVKSIKIPKEVDEEVQSDDKLIQIDIEKQPVQQYQSQMIDTIFNFIVRILPQINSHFAYLIELQRTTPSLLTSFITNKPSDDVSEQFNQLSFNPFLVLSDCDDKPLQNVSTFKAVSRKNENEKELLLNKSKNVVYPTRQIRSALFGFEGDRWDGSASLLTLALFWIRKYSSKYLYVKQNKNLSDSDTKTSFTYTTFSTSSQLIPSLSDFTDIIPKVFDGVLSLITSAPASSSRRHVVAFLASCFSECATFTTLFTTNQVVASASKDSDNQQLEGNEDKTAQLEEISQKVSVGKANTSTSISFKEIPFFVIRRLFPSSSSSSIRSFLSHPINPIASLIQPDLPHLSNVAHIICCGVPDSQVASTAEYSLLPLPITWPLFAVQPSSYTSTLSSSSTSSSSSSKQPLPYSSGSDAFSFSSSLFQIPPLAPSVQNVSQAIKELIFMLRFPSTLFQKWIGNSSLFISAANAFHLSGSVQSEKFTPGDSNESKATEDGSPSELSLFLSSPLREELSSLFELLSRPRLSLISDTDVASKLCNCLGTTAFGDRLLSDVVLVLLSSYSPQMRMAVWNCVRENPILFRTLNGCWTMWEAQKVKGQSNEGRSQRMRLIFPMIHHPSLDRQLLEIGCEARNMSLKKNGWLYVSLVAQLASWTFVDFPDEYYAAMDCVYQRSTAVNKSNSFASELLLGNGLSQSSSTSPTPVQPSSKRSTHSSLFQNHLFCSIFGYTEPQRHMAMEQLAMQNSSLFLDVVCFYPPNVEALFSISEDDISYDKIFNQSIHNLSDEHSSNQPWLKSHEL
ncbi:putative RNA polymerase II-associated protein 1 [Monocercomonoides exilis]|uniref:putative RNA polymerase II-associated protein 1 n=1 Tax=Monocercomonoides exilis TaxID=2049356 RepID=UPI0035594A9B|nr:putative RNA polymerase II-associated protein 1 [Monocercomonoides exilis]|eukprot:MONOS_12563.1-p1 / transcript=MONOS_12563.1 / gene=MONOS_12563 / organism=Monocercomonoides_exilis_PA203 / gene_product=unspecified product / transcript_product=unspecified product / location=Mono_scaffold00703:2047-8285(-) / protein_length=1968 / sequence_SO=supercontig / SO=protein_coding / is_pseudo=false